MIVVDTNVVAYLFLSSEYAEQAERAFRADAHWAAPRLWRSEFRNVLALHMRRRMLSLDEALRIMGRATAIVADDEHDLASGAVLRLAHESGCSAYDCEFVALAMDLGVPLLTVDRQLLEAFPDVAVSLDRT